MRNGAKDMSAIIPSQICQNIFCQKTNEDICKTIADYINPFYKNHKNFFSEVLVANFSDISICDCNCKNIKITVIYKKSLKIEITTNRNTASVLGFYRNESCFKSNTHFIPLSLKQYIISLGKGIVKKVDKQFL